MRMHGAMAPHPHPSSFFSLSCTHTIPFGLAFPSPNLFPSSVTHCAGKSDFLFSRGSKLRAQPCRRRMRSHILGLSADPQGPVFTERLQKNATVAPVHPEEDTLFSLTAPLCFSVNHESRIHTDTPWLI